MYFLLNKCKSQQDLNPTEQFVLFRIFNLVTILPKSEDKKAIIFLAPSNLSTSLLVFVCCYFFAFNSRFLILNHTIDVQSKTLKYHNLL